MEGRICKAVTNMIPNSEEGGQVKSTRWFRIGNITLTNILPHGAGRYIMEFKVDSLHTCF